MSVQVLYWQDVPSMVKAADGSKRRLSDWFQQEIDRRAMEQGLVGSDAYLEHWHWEERDGDLDEVAAMLEGRSRGPQSS
ncbi:MAG TPA: virulence factor [Gaiellaceae bacterium]|nr:virulence factor [Gaiellaceae bacterium]